MNNTGGTEENFNRLIKMNNNAAETETEYTSGADDEVLIILLFFYPLMY